MNTQEMPVPGEEIILQSVQLRAKHSFRAAISLIEDNIEKIPPQLHACAWYEAFNAARAWGDTEKAKRFMLAIDDADPAAFGS